YVASIAPGTDAELELLRDGEPMRLDVKIGYRPEDQEFAQARLEPQAANDRLGITVRPLAPARARQLGIDGGVEIAAVAPEGPAGRAGAGVNDVIVELQRRPIRSLKDYGAALAALRSGEMALIRLQREGAAIYVALRVP
ncbi:MAG: PDZ domain-containing protein, partial [Myxococcales bacterium]